MVVVVHNSAIEDSHYFKPHYDTKYRFISYWHQIDELRAFRNSSILEVGIGNGFLSNYLKRRGYAVTTFDIEPFLNPDVVGTVSNMPFADNAFEVVCCFEVLEHLPYKAFYQAMAEIHRVCWQFAILSLPDCSRYYRLFIQVPKFGDLKCLLSLPRLRKPIQQDDGQHYWEIGKKGYPLKRIERDVRKAKFNIVREYRVFEHPYYHFFVLQKKENN